MHSDWPLSRDLVLIGGGHTHALVLRQWGMNPLAGVRVTLINPGATAPYTGMLPGYIAGHYERDELDIDLVRLARFAGARIIFDKAAGIDTTAKRVKLEGRAPVQYDIASIDVGVSAELPGVEGFSSYAHSVKPLGAFADAWKSFLERTNEPGIRTSCVVIGGGVAGIEIALAMAHRLRAAGLNQASVTVVEAGPKILSGVTAGARRALQAALARYHVSVLTSAETRRITSGVLHLSDGGVLPADFIVSAAGARPYAWIAETGLEQTNGYINVRRDLRATGDSSLFAVGDCAHMPHAPREKAGVFAVRQAPVLFQNLQAALRERPLGPYHPQSDFLKLISMGDKSVVAQKYGIALSAPWLWKIKNRIDRAFMERLCDLPAMPPAAIPNVRAMDEEQQDQPLCGGCGSKVGQEDLAAALAGLGPSGRADIVRGHGDDAAILNIGGKLQAISTDHLRAFTEDPYVLARIAAIHALGDVWAMGATPQSALVSMIIPRMNSRMQIATVAEVTEAVRGVLAEAGAELVGGHTSMGQEMTIGLTVTGLLDGPAIGLSGAEAGDTLILTKPLGTGVILAGEMRGMTRGSFVEQALRSMQRPLGPAARVLAPHAHAMTDVTGFGLAGHLMNILEASGKAATLDLGKLPFLPGAEQLSAAGVRSSIWRSNARLDPKVSRPTSAISDLIYDPQTAGGLLAAVPAASAPDILEALQAAGEPTWVIGEIQEGAPHITLC